MSMPVGMISTVATSAVVIMALRHPICSMSTVASGVRASIVPSRSRPASTISTDWVVIAWMKVAAALTAVARPAAPQFLSFSGDPKHILEGNWQSCLQRDGSWKIARSLNALYPWNPPR